MVARQGKPKTTFEHDNQYYHQCLRESNGEMRELEIVERSQPKVKFEKAALKDKRTWRQKVAFSGLGVGLRICNYFIKV